MARSGGYPVIEADASSGLVNYARLCEDDAEQEISLGELGEETTLDEASALRARESVEATALEVDALVRRNENEYEQKTRGFYKTKIRSGTGMSRPLPKKARKNPTRFF
jgi:hypothetical protein